MRVPFFKPAIGEREIEAVVECMRSGWLTTGPATLAFEEEFAAFVGAKHAVALNSCTAALHLALEAIGVKRGDRVLVPTMTFAATAEVVRYFDAVPVFVDCESQTQCIDPDLVEQALNANADGPVRAIIPMHYAGQMADMGRIHELARARGIAVIEDAAHAVPAEFRRDARSDWHMVGVGSDVACFSFYANKCITTGEGGMATTDNDALAERMRLMSLHGMSKDAWKRFSSSGSWYYEVVAPGFKYNLTDIASAIGRVQLSRAHELWQQRREIASWYHRALAKIEGIELPTELSDRRHAWHLFSIRLDLATWTSGRSAFIEALKERGIGASVHWQPLHMQPYYRETYGMTPEQFPVAAALWPRLVSLPLYPGMTVDDVSYVADAIRTIPR